MSEPSFSHGDRIRYETTGDDGFPLVRYGFVGGADQGGSVVVVLLDGDIGDAVVDASCVRPVDISNVTLSLDGADLLDDPQLRRGLVDLWHAEAEDAGLQIAAIHHIETGLGVRDSSEGFALAELTTAGEDYMLRATRCANNTVLVGAMRPNRWIF
ncbi:MAG: hypothetical protein AB8G26_07920 [Ilumatobacter sp.]